MSSESYKAVFFIVPAKILDLPGITIQLLRFYETIFQFWHHGKDCYLTNDVIKERTGIKSDSTISNAFQFFEDANLLKRVTQRGGMRYIVQVLSTQIRDEDAQDPSLQRDPPPRQRETPPLATARHNMKNINMKNNNKDYCASDDARSKIDQIGFDEFWKIYPRRKDKAKAKKRWDKIKPEERPLILSKLKEQIAKDPQYQGDPQYIPHATTYLNGRRWEDEICVASAQPSTFAQQKQDIVRTTANTTYSNFRDFTQERLDKEANQRL